MEDNAKYRIQFFRQWLGDTDIEDITAGGGLDQVAALAQVNLEAFARDRSGRLRPRIARIVDPASREILAEYRLTQEGPVEVRVGARTDKPGPTARLRLVD